MADDCCSRIENTFAEVKPEKEQHRFLVSLSLPSN